MPTPLQLRHNDHDGVSNHQPHGCLLNRAFGRRSKKTSKLRATGLCAGNSSWPVNSPHKGPVTRKMFPLDDVIMHKHRQHGHGDESAANFFSLCTSHITLTVLLGCIWILDFHLKILPVLRRYLCFPYDVIMAKEKHGLDDGCTILIFSTDDGCTR